MTITALSDAELLGQARDGDEAAFTELYVRHQAAALRLASTYKRVGDPDDLVNGAFERVLGAIRRGTGPTESFRAYLFVTLRRLAAEQGQTPADRSLDEVPEPVADEADAPELARADRELITQAFESLPDRWQAVLWHTAVEGRQPKELAAVLGVSANAAAAMSYRAREKLRQAYLQAHLLASPAPEHEPYRSQLGAYVRDGLSTRDRAAVQAHLDSCEPCRDLVAELTDVNRMLVRSVVPLFLLVGGSGALAAAGAAAAAAGTADAAGKGSAAGTAAGGIGSKLKHLAPTVGNVAAIAAVVAGVVGLGLAAGRGQTGPLNKAADAADIGAAGGSRSGSGGSGVGGGSDSGSSLFGSGDFGIGSLDGDFASFAGDTGSSLFGSRSGRSSRTGRFDTPPPSSRRTTPTGSNRATSPASGGTTPAPTPPQGGTTPPPGPGPGPGPGPVTPTPPPLTFASSTWTPSAVGQGALAFTIGERGAPDNLTASAFQARAGLTGTAGVTAADQADPAPLRVQVALTPGARAFPDTALDSRCSAPATAPDGTQTIDCSLVQPPTGGTERFSFLLQVDAPEQTAMLRLYRGDALEAELPAAVPLEQYQAGLDLTDPTWSPYTTNGRPLPAGRIGVGAANAGTRTIPGATVRITLGGDAGFVPPVLFTDLVPSEFLDLLALPPALRQRLETEILDPLPAGCAVEGWNPPAPAPGVGWGSVLQGGLPTTIVCQVGDLAPGATPSFAGLLVATHPLYHTGTGKDGTATVTLELQGTVVATRTLPLTGGGNDPDG
jgi:RNA polymerase sigma factor (sigma-70 family)